ncbi:thioredoxin-like protein [Diplogelasinospora grovesii]|uniref:Thioredoxin-like protein n=1 Tax=Diplogelasinospora grovesii TaxID=303347 RepID=A0AAN6N365_9PEZI|nr:thioredoxin-like protein [Diplogelasinospora grovesii]
MLNPTPAEEEFAHFLAKNSGSDDPKVHSEDRDYARGEAAEDSGDEEDRFRASQIDAAMRMPTLDSRHVRLPPTSFDSGHSTGVKGVIADARSYESARRKNWKAIVGDARRSVFGMEGVKKPDQSSGPESEGSGAEDADEQRFLEEWRESRRRELEAESRGGSVRTRRTSPSVRLFGRLDAVDALGYLDAIEKVGRETVVVVFVFDHECMVSSTIEHALMSLVGTYPAVHFVKVHYEDIEFDNAGVPAILAYRNQGDLFANLTGIIEMIPDDEEFSPSSLKRIFTKHGIF